MRRAPSLLKVTTAIFLVGQLYIIWLLLRMPLNPRDLASAAWRASRKPLTLDAAACECPPVAGAWRHRGLALGDGALDFNNTPISPLRPPPWYLPGRTAPLPALVSVVIPYYNAAATIRDTVASVLRQSLQWFEILIVDDASPAADTPATLAALEHLDDRIRVIRRHANGGLAATRNTGAAEARGEFLYFLDADDLIEGTALEASAWFVRCRPTHAFVGGWTLGFGAQQYLWKRGFADPTVFVRENVVTATKMVRKEHFEEVGGFDAELRNGNEDWEFWLRMANAGRWGATLPLAMDWYRRKPREQSTAEWAAWTEKGQRAFLSLMRSRYPRLFERGEFPTLVPEPAFNSSKLWNPLQKPLTTRRLLFVTVPRPADTSRRQALLRLVQCGWQLTVCLPAPDSGLGAEDLTPDVFVLPAFVDMPSQFAPFVAYVGQSRQADAVIVHKTYRAALERPLYRANLTMLDEGDFLAALARCWTPGA